MTDKTMPEQSVLLNLFRYEPEAGKLYFLPRLSKRFNTRWLGKEAFTFIDKRGYRHGKILGTNYQAHRVIWKMVYGVEPEQIDHINCNPSDNRIANLRSCTSAENCRNYKKSGLSSSKYRGVSWAARDKTWIASIRDAQSKKLTVGRFDNEFCAALAYDDAAKKHHGEFATLNFPDTAAQADYERRILDALE